MRNTDGMSSPRPVRSAVCVALALLVLVARPVPAQAHASLVETTPFDGQSLTASPDEVVLTFSEDVQAPTGSLRVFDNDGNRVDSGLQRDVTTDAVAVAITAELQRGAYIATYRVVSEDGHVIRGAFVFTIGEGQAVSEQTLARVFGAGGDTAVSLLSGLLRVLTHGAVLLLAGAVLWRRRVAQDAADVREAADWQRRATVVGLVTTALAVPVQSMLSSGLGVAALGNSTLLAETATGSVGQAAMIRVVGLVVVLVGIAGSRDTVVGAGAVVALVSFVADGHTRTVDPAALMIVGDLVHLAAVAVWLGGVWLLRGAWRRRRLADDPVGAATLVARFSTLATWSLLVVAASGSAMTWANVRQPRALTSTEYGWTLVVKLGLVAVLVVLGAYNNRRLVPLVGRGDGLATAAWRRLGTTVRVEAAVMAVVLVVTGALVNLRPAAEEAGITGAFDTYVEVSDDLSLNLVVDPNRAGANEIHMYLFDDTGRPLTSDAVEEVTIELSLPERDLGPVVRAPYVAGPGHWQLDGNDLVLAGAWELTVVVDVDRISVERIPVTVVVNG